MTSPCCSKEMRFRITPTPQSALAIGAAARVDHLRGARLASRVADSPPDAPSDPFAAVAPFYDLDLEGYEDDIEMYRRLGEAAGPRVLELGCGTGRVAAVLAADGLEVTGVDLSPAMLEVARARAPGIRWLEDDMRSLDIGERFDAVIVPLGGLQHLETVDDVVAAFEVIAAHLDAGGVVVVDVEATAAEDFTAGPQPLVQHWSRWWPEGDARVTKLVAVEPLPADGLREVTWHFDVQPREGPLRRATQQFMLRTFTAAELELAGRLAGLEVTGLFGGYDLEPYDDGSARLIVTFEHTDGDRDAHEEAE
ncbi:MAG: methyltransferase domain-containing protein [Dehalococcoidia bacterium]|nr:methyltransferase domain-containing protein [Dehalococcoidia bacterium]